MRTCDTSGCDEKHPARGLCRRHYYQSRRRSGETDRKGLTSHASLLPALVKRYNDHGEFIEEPWRTNVRAVVGESLVFVSCPSCGGTMWKLGNPDMDLRDCGGCRIRARLNEEEVSWLISQARSSRASLQTAS